MNADTTIRTTSDGIPVHGYLWWPDDGVVRGIVQIAHGLAEHGLRYERFAEALTEDGWAVVAHDHRGHGQSVATEADRGHFADADGWTKAVDDLIAMRKVATDRWPDVPVVLFGHSMGSSLVLSSLWQRPGGVDAAVLCAPVGRVGFLRVLGHMVARVERRRLGRRGRSQILHQMSFGDFNRAFSPTRTSHDWLSRDPDEVDGYVADPLCGAVATTQHWVDHLVALGENVDVQHLSRIESSLPIYVIAGSMDPVSKGTTQIVPLLARLREAGVQVVEHRFWPDGRHEILNEINRDEVVGDLLDWLHRRVPRESA